MFEGQENKEKDQDRVHDCFDHFRRWGYVIFPDNQRIYEHINENMIQGEVLEAGCGNGVGTGILSQNALRIKGTDKIAQNVKFCKAMFPWLEFDVWDISANSHRPRFDVVVCVETIEHVADYRQAVKNLIASAKREVWISTPVVKNPEHPPTNPFHTREFTEEEVLDLIGDHKVDIPFKGLFHITI